MWTSECDGGCGLVSVIVGGTSECDGGCGLVSVMVDVD